LYTRMGIELPDLLLMRAELEARENNLTSAVTDVQTLRNNRIPPAVAGVPAATQTNQTALIQFIISERTREFAETGARWFDMRRLSNDPLFPNVSTATHKLYNDDAGDTFTTFTLTPARLTLRIPPYYLSQNPGMVDNP
jgi:starch-binding outer membrane protein, SusD/RagB family